MQIENVFKFAMLFIRRFFIPFVFVLSLRSFFSLLLVVCVFRLFRHRRAESSKAIYWFDLRSFGKLIFILCLRLVHFGIQWFSTVCPFWLLLYAIFMWVRIEQRNWIDLLVFSLGFVDVVVVVCCCCAQTDVAKLLLVLKIVRA